MNREIKFSYIAQHEETGIFMEQVFSIEEIEGSGFVKQWQDKFPRFGKWIARREFTGLKDKNGKEIYEGDIYDCWSEGVHKIGVVTWGLAGFYIKVSAPQVIWYFSGGSEPGEVIGNIYENPELIK